MLDSIKSLTRMVAVGVLVSDDAGRYRRLTQTLGATLGVFGACVLFSGAASAADPVIVKITASGPDRSYPLGQDFRVEGKPKRVPEQVDLVFVRVAHPVFGIADPAGEKKCTTVRDAMSEGERVKKFKDDTIVGRTTVGELWEADETVKSLAAYRASPWKRESEKDESYSLTVPSDDFFRAGARYCAFLLYADKTPLVTKGLMSAVVEFADGWQRCNEPSPSVPCPTVSQKYDSELGNALTKAHLSAADEASIRDEMQKLKSHLSAVQEAAVRLEGVLRTWERVFRPAAMAVPFSDASNKPNYLEVNTHPLGRLVVALLVADGSLVAVPGAASGQQGLTYHTPDGKARVTHVSLGGDLSTIRITSDHKDPAKSLTLDAKTSKVMLPGFEISLRDILELSSGRLRFGDKYLHFKEGYESVLAAAIDKNGLAIDSSKFKKDVDPFITYLDQLGAAMTRAWETQPASPTTLSRTVRPVPVLLRWEPVYDALREWLQGEVLNECMNIQLMFNGSPPMVCTWPFAKTAAWPGFDPGSPNPVGALASTLKEIRDKSAQARDIKTALDSRQQRSSTSISSITAGSKVDRDAWFAQYVVTTVGFAAVTGTGESFWVNYYGFKLYPWANRVDEPKSIFGGSNLYQLFSFELAFVPNLQAFGPSSRFQGLSNGAVPPLMLGVALQPLPYLTASFGFIAMTHRRTVLPQEQAETFLRPYLAIAADVNILDLAASALGKARSDKLSAIVTP